MGAGKTQYLAILRPPGCCLSFSAYLILGGATPPLCVRGVLNPIFGIEEKHNPPSDSASFAFECFHFWNHLWKSFLFSGQNPIQFKEKGGGGGTCKDPNEGQQSPRSIAEQPCDIHAKPFLFPHAWFCLFVSPSLCGLSLSGRALSGVSHPSCLPAQPHVVCLPLRLVIVSLRRDRRSGGGDTSEKKRGGVAEEYQTHRPGSVNPPFEFPSSL